MSRKNREQRTPLVVPENVVKVYLTEKDVEHRLNYAFLSMLRGLSKMLEIWGNLECKGGGVIDPHEALFHCRACIINGIKSHVDQAISRLERE